MYDETLSKMGFTDSLENNITITENFINNLEEGLKKQDESIQGLLDQLESMPPEAKEKIKEKQGEDNIIEHARALKEYSFSIYSLCVKTRENFNNKKPEFKTNNILWNYMCFEFLPAIDKIQEMNGKIQE